MQKGLVDYKGASRTPMHRNGRARFNIGGFMRDMITPPRDLETTRGFAPSSLSLGTGAANTVPLVFPICANWLYLLYEINSHPSGVCWRMSYSGRDWDKGGQSGRMRLQSQNHWNLMEGVAQRRIDGGNTHYIC
jgi:hypothetical protein